MLGLTSSAHSVPDHWLAALDIGVTHFTVCDIRDGCGVRLDGCRMASLHYCLSGVGTLAVHRARPIRLDPHTFVLLPPRIAFTAALRRAFGELPMSLVKLVRLRRASELLVATTLPVADVAKRVGFSSRSNFSLAFGQLHGMDPSRFRRKFSVGARAR